MIRLLTLLALTLPFHLVGASAAADSQPVTPRVLPAGEVPHDHRLAPLRNLNSYFPFEPPSSIDAWHARADRVRRQILVSTGLWPMPAATPANAVTHGRVDRPEYTVERVYLESFPGHFVTGSLYRPKGVNGRCPGVLCPYGHWADGRFHDAGKDAVRREIVAGAERFEDGGRSPLQSMCVQLARMGCVVFQYDMVGYADSQQIPYAVAHGFKKRRPEMETRDGWGFFSPAAELHLQNIMGLQTYNSLRTLDWFCSLPDVDPARIGVTGGSGGGTQTFLLCAVDPRPAVAFPAVMVSTGMQGGCTCENAPLLRIDTGNVEFAALFAPKPLGMTGADDWTVDLTRKGLPELQRLYKMLGDESLVMGRSLNQFGHNYNYVSRGVMYEWFNRHLHLGFEEPIVAENYHPLSVAEMTVWDDSHRRPPSGEDYERSLLRSMTEASQKQLAALAPHDTASLEEYRRIVGGALEVLVAGSMPAPADIEFQNLGETNRGSYTETKGLARNKPRGTELPVIFLRPQHANGTVVAWIDSVGKAGLFEADGQPRASVRALLDAGSTVAAADLLYQGEFNADGKPPTSARHVAGRRDCSAYTSGYNRTLFAERIADVLTLVACIRNQPNRPARVQLVALNGAGRWGAPALALSTLASIAAGDHPAIDSAAVDSAGFRFEQLTSIDDVDFLPGAVKYGDLPSLLSLAAPTPLWLAGEGTSTPPIVRAAYAAAGHTDAVHSYAGSDEGREAAAIEWLLKSADR